MLLQEKSRNEEYLAGESDRVSQLAASIRSQKLMDGPRAQSPTLYIKHFSS